MLRRPRAGSASGGLAIFVPGHASGGHISLLVQRNMEKKHAQGGGPPLGNSPRCSGKLAFPQSRYGGDLYAKRHRPLPLPGVAGWNARTGIALHLGIA